ncbi:MAG TPA: AlkA N-terminal domain-containing protein [Solirubrobacteraceae bacterium]|nr:AlkA N-terminal domain-containing protein [Solirubrobacteraceae bacterium]
MKLPLRPPLDDRALLAHFRARAVLGIEEVDEHGYRRSLRLPGGPGVVELAVGPASVVAELDLADDRDVDAAVELCEAMLGLHGDPAVVLDALGDDPLIGGAVRAFPGRRVPGTPDGDELAVRAVLGQQISLAGAATAAARLVRELGEPLPRPLGAVTHLFPTAASLAAADPDGFRMPRSRARTLHALTTALADREIVLERNGDRAHVRAQLLALPGIGPWTADYVVMRALGDTDVFLATDLGVRRALQRLGVDGEPAAAATLAQRWRPYRSFAMQYLWAMPDGG